MSVKVIIKEGNVAVEMVFSSRKAAEKYVEFLSKRKKNWKTRIEENQNE